MEAVSRGQTGATRRQGLQPIAGNMLCLHVIQQCLSKAARVGGCLDLPPRNWQRLGSTQAHQEARSAPPKTHGPHSLPFVVTAGSEIAEGEGDEGAHGQEDEIHTQGFPHQKGRPA
eukprot:5580892-Amphidinium_carterae.1